MDELAAMLERVLKKNFKHSSVKVAACPDLRALGVCCEGLCGWPCIVEVMYYCASFVLCFVLCFVPCFVICVLLLLFRLCCVL